MAGRRGVIEILKKGESCGAGIEGETEGRRRKEKAIVKRNRVKVGRLGEERTLVAGVAIV